MYVIVAELKALSSPDVQDLRSFVGAGSFALLLEAEIGQYEKPGGDIFHLAVVSEEWLVERVRLSGGLFSHGYFIVDRFDYRRIWDTISRYSARCTGESWNDVVRQLCRVMTWEFDNYRDAT
jgi:hypothetical protein